MELLLNFVKYSSDLSNSVLAMSWVIACILILSAVCLIFLYVNLSDRTKKMNALINKHVLVTGGSSGIGRSIALEAASRGANVTIVARNQSKLTSVNQEMINACNKNSPVTGAPIFQAISLDVMEDFETIEKEIRHAEASAGPVHMLVNCAGTSICSKFEDTSVEQFEKMVKLNLLGSVSPAKAVIRGMKANGGGHIVFTSSQAGLVGIYGYTAYSASKYALRGLAEALHMEVKQYGVSVTVALPSDTDTPGFVEEEKSKLDETRLISQASGLWSPDIVARKILDDAIMGKFYSTVGFEGAILTLGCAGMSPVTSFIELGLQVLLMGPLRLVAACYLYSFDRIVKQCMKNRDKRKKSE